MLISDSLKGLSDVIVITGAGDITDDETTSAEEKLETFLLQKENRARKDLIIKTSRNYMKKIKNNNNDKKKI